MPSEQSLKTAAEKEEAHLLSYIIALGALVLTLLIGRFLEKRHVHWMPHSGVGVLVGALCAGLLRWESGFSRTHLDNDVLRDERFDNAVFMTILLPPIIFDAGFNVDLDSALRNLGPTTFFAFAGTTFSTGVIGMVCYTAGQLGLCYPLGFLASLTFGSLISATDPVSVLSVFKTCGVHDDIYAIVFGESVLNDAVAIVLTRTLLAFNVRHDEEDDEEDEDAGAAVFHMVSKVLYALFLFLFEFTASLAIGALFGGLLALLLERLALREDDKANGIPSGLEEDDGCSESLAPASSSASTNTTSPLPPQPPPKAIASPSAIALAAASPAAAAAEPIPDDLVLTVSLCFAFPWASYYTAEALELSGIVTLLFCGMVMAQYARPHMSVQAVRVSSATFKTMGFVAETGVFIYLGEALFSFPILHNTVWRLVLIAMVGCGLGRAHVPAGVWLTNKARANQQQSKRAIPNRELRRDAPLQHLSHGVSITLWWSGLRGGVAFALASAFYSRFMQHCGGLAHGAAQAMAKGSMRHCSEGKGTAQRMTDGLAMLQTTLIVATCSIFVLGGSIKRVAESTGVLKKPETSLRMMANRRRKLTGAGFA